MHQEAASNFIRTLKGRGTFPKNIQLAALKCGTLASIFDEQSSGIISESVCSGVDRDPAVAVLKGIVEYVERQAFANGRTAGLPICQTLRSDGFAAFPRSEFSNAAAIARANALDEAVERYAWAKWWDDQSITHEVRTVDLRQLEPGETPLLDVVEAVQVSSIFEVRPRLGNSDLSVRIYFVFVEGAGVLSGGACGSTHDIESIRYRALAELTRHAYALRKMNVEAIAPSTFYEKRLAYFGNTDAGKNAAHDRLSARGTRAVQLPDLRFDGEVAHSVSDLVVVHRCYFEDQPDFVGGKLERLCL